MTKRERIKFNEYVWDERVDFIQKFYEKESHDSEDIFVDAMPTPQMVLVEYRGIRKKQLYSRTFKFPVDMLTHLSDTTTAAIAMDLLQWFRSDPD